MTASVAEICLDVAALGIEFGHTEAFDDFLRLAASIDADPAVAFFLGVVEGAGEAVALDEFGLEVGGLCLEFLHADDVGTLAGQPVEEAFGGGGADAVEVGRYNSHQD